MLASFQNQVQFAEHNARFDNSNSRGTGFLELADEAKEKFKQAAQRNPPWLYANNSGFGLFRMRRWEDVIEWRFLQLQPTSKAAAREKPKSIGPPGN